jgi:uncharacterized protein YjiS (DUF1127 family)
MSHHSRHRFAAQTVGLATVVEAQKPRPLHARLRATLRRWQERIAARRQLAAMDARSLREAGISPAAAAFEASKPFWRPMGPLR